MKKFCFTLIVFLFLLTGNGLTSYGQSFLSKGNLSEGDGKESVAEQFSLENWLETQKLPFDYETLHLVFRLLEEQEYNLALAILNNLQPLQTPSDQSSSYLIGFKELSTEESFPDPSEDFSEDPKGSGSVNTRALGDSMIDREGFFKIETLTTEAIDAEVSELEAKNSKTKTDEISSNEISSNEVKITEERTLSEIEEEERQERNRIIRESFLEQKGDRDFWVQKSDYFILKELNHYLLIESHYRLGHYQQVLSQARGYFESFANADHFSKVYYFYALAQFQLREPLEFTSLITPDLYQSLSKQEAMKLRKTLSADALRSKSPLAAINFLLSEEGILLPGYEAWIVEIMAKITDSEDIEEMVPLFENPFLLNELALKKVELSVRDGFFNEANEILNDLLENEINPELYSRIQKLKDFVQLSYEAEPFRIGVILPFSHKSAGRIARQVLEGVEIAMQDFSVGLRKIELILKDSQVSKSAKANAKHTKKLVEELVREDRVMAIVGPLYNTRSKAAGEIAEKYKIPIVSLTLSENIGKDLDFLFRFQRNKVEESETMASYAMDYLGAKRFAIFYPAGKGFQQMEAFSKKVREKGGDIVGISEIQSKQVDFQEAFRAMTGGFRFSKEEIAEIRRARDPFPYIIDFDAIYIPSDPKKVRMISSFSKAVNAEKSWILGGHLLNTSLNYSLTDIPKLRFADTYSIGETSTALKLFFESHWKKYNFHKNYQKPNSYTIYGYETMQILIGLLRDPINQTRESLRNALASLKDYPVMSGTVTTHENGELSKEIQILKLRYGQTVLAIEKQR